MSMSFSVRVVDEERRPRHGVRVYADFGLANGGLVGYTDDDGCATFLPSRDYDFAGIFVDGEKLGECNLSDGETYSFTL